MKKRFRVRLGLALVVLATCCFSVPGPQVVVASSSSYSQDAKGLEKQLEPLAKAWSKHDAAAIDEHCKTFALPDPSAWFSKYFAKDQVQQLVWDDEAEVDNFKTVTPRMMNLLGKGQKFHAKVSTPGASSATKLQPRTDAVVPITPVPIEQFTVTFIAENGRSFSILANFVYVDGAYRYVGKGAYPFWSMPDATRK
jgi:hypothetical protein